MKKPIRTLQVAVQDRRGVATLWVIIALPVLLVALCFAIESARLWLMRQQLVVSLESAAMAAVRVTDATNGGGGTLPGRRAAVELAGSNTVDGAGVIPDLNFDAAALPNQNADCDGDIVFGTILQRGGQRVFDTTLPGGCGDEAIGPKAVSLVRTSVAGWQTVRLCDRRYASMVVVGTPNYTVARTPSVVRIRNVTADSFDFFVQSTNTGAPVRGVPVHFLIVEEGVYSLAADGVRMEAVKYRSTVTDSAPFNWIGQARPYLNPGGYFRPVVVGQVMSFNDPDWSVFWSRGFFRTSQASSFFLRTGKHVGEDPDATRSAETVGYIVIESGAGSMRGLPYYAARGPDTVEGMQSPPYTYALPGSPIVPGGFAVASQSGMDGSNGSWPILYGTDPVSDTALQLAVDEDQLGDAERVHITENVHYIVLAGPWAARVQTDMTVSYLSTFGCPLIPPELSGRTVAWFDCAAHRPRLTKVDRVICP